jgi:hypothetical protein
MRFSLPRFPCDFEIPDDWLDAASFRNFTASTPSFRSTPDAVFIPIAEVEPPSRFTTSPNSWRGFDRDRMVRALDAVVTGAELPPIPVVLLPELDDRLATTPAYYRCRFYNYRTRDGYHRFYASVAAGFEFLPAEVSEVSDLVKFCRDVGWCS